MWTSFCGTDEKKVFYTVNYCPGCKCQRTFHSTKGFTYLCDECGHQMRYVPDKKKKDDKDE